MIHIIFKLFTLLIYSKAHFEDEPYPTDSDLLDYQEGIVGNESFVYYYIHHSGNIVLSLASSHGDADLYISGSRVFPTYYPEMYDIHSATCGVEIIEIPASFRSPISVGVYGHSAHELSHYVLKVFKNPEVDKAYAVIHNDLPEDIKESFAVPHEEQKSKISKPNIKINTPSKKRNDIFSLSEIIGLIFL